jgi:hypothetical protein
MRNDREQILKPVRAGTKNQKGNSPRAEVLVERQVFVERQQNIEFWVGLVRRALTASKAAIAASRVTEGKLSRNSSSVSSASR